MRPWCPQAWRYSRRTQPSWPSSSRGQQGLDQAVSRPAPLMPTSTTSWFRGLQPASEHSCQKWPQGRWFLFNIITIPRVLMPNHLSHPLQPGRARPCTNSERKILHLSSFYSLIQTKLHFNKCRTNALLKEIASLIKVFKLNVTDGIY